MSTEPKTGVNTTAQSPRFLLLYALAAAGGAVAYVPFLTILFPMRITDLVGVEDIEWLAYATFAGAVSASLTNILFGWLSDRTGTRKAWIWGGLIGSSALLIGFSQVTDIRATIVLLVLWQIALNMMLSPLAAWAGDSVPDEQKGRLGGLLAFAPTAGALAGALITIPGLAGDEGRLWLVAGMVIACVLPALLFSAPKRMPQLEPNRPDQTSSDQNPQQEKPQQSPRPPQARNIVVRMWLARLLAQISEAGLFAFLYYWFRSVDPAMDDARIAQIFSVILIASVPLALWAGTWSDRNGRPFAPLPVAAFIGAIGLLIMALSNSLITAIAGYVVFGLAISVFLALHTSQTLRILPKPENRGRDLGLFNLTNTSPSLVMPWLTIGLVPIFGFSGLFVALSICAFIASILLATIPSHR